MRLFEFDTAQPTLYSYWDLIVQLGLDKEASKLHDSLLPWVNNNRNTAIDKLIKNAKYREVALLQLFFKVGLNHRNYGTPATTVEDFQKFKESSITCWRGGGGIYKESFRNRPWFSFTIDQERLGTFSTYDGTYGSSAYKLPTRKGHIWEVELTLPVSHILMYSNLQDEELIISAQDAANAKVIKQT